MRVFPLPPWGFLPNPSVGDSRLRHHVPVILNIMSQLVRGHRPEPGSLQVLSRCLLAPHGAEAFFAGSKSVCALVEKVLASVVACFRDPAPPYLTHSPGCPPTSAASSKYVLAQSVKVLSMMTGEAGVR